MTDWDRVIQAGPPEESAAEPVKSDSNKWDQIIAAGDTNRLLQDNPGWTTTTKQAIRMLGQGGLRGIAMDIGLPVDTMNMAGDFLHNYPEIYHAVMPTPLAGLGTTREFYSPGKKVETGSTEHVRKIMEGMGLPTKSAKEEGITDTSAHWTSTIGEFGGANLPFAAMLPVKAATSVPTAAAKYTPAVVDAFKSLPSAGHLLKEIGVGGVGPGTGAELLESAVGYFDPKYAEAGKVTGALLGSLRVKAIETAFNKSKDFGSWLHDFMGFGTGSRKVAGAQLAATTQDLSATRQALESVSDLPPGFGAPLGRPDGRVLPSNIPVAIEAGDLGTLALSASIAKRDAVHAGDMQAAQDAIENAWIAYTKLDRGNFESTEAWLTARQQELERLANRRVSQAVNEAERATETAFQNVETLGPEAQAAKKFQSDVMRAEILSAQDDMRAVVDAKWKDVDKTVLANADPAIEKFRALKAEHDSRPMQDRQSWPKEQYAKLFDADGDPRSTLRLQDIIDADSAIQHEIRTLRDPLKGAQDPVRISYLQRMSEVLNEVKYSTAVVNQTPEQVARLKDAIGATKTFHDTFSRGPVGKALGFDRAGGVDVPSGETIKQFLSSGPGGVDSFNAFMKAAGARTGQTAPIHSEAGMMELMGKYLRQDFYDKVMPNGSFNNRAAQQWMSNNAGPMQHPQFQQLRKEFDAAIQSQGTATQMREFEKQTTEQIRNNAAALFLENPGHLFNSVFDAPDKFKATRELIAMTKGDPTGRATEGVAQMALDRMLADAMEPTHESFRLGRVNGYKAAKWAEANQGMIRALDQEIPGFQQRFDQLAEGAKYIEGFQVRSAIPSQEQSMTGGMLRTLMARVMGAKMFAHFAEGGSSIQTAAIGSQTFKLIANAATPDQAKRLLRDAMFDKQLFADLTKNWNNASPQQQAVAYKRLQPYLFSVGIPISQPLSNPQERPKEDAARARYRVYDPVPTLGVP